MSHPREAGTGGVADGKGFPQCPFTIQQLEAVSAPLLGDRPVRVGEVFSGNINTMIRRI